MDAPRAFRLPHANTIAAPESVIRLDRRAGAALAAGTVGLLLVGTGAAAPWVTVFAGLQPVVGFDLDGGYLAGVAFAAAAALLIAAVTGGARWLRPASAVAGLFVVADSLYTQSRIAAYVADPGPAGALTQPATGPGAALMALGGGLIIAAAAIAPLRRDRLAPGIASRLFVALGLFVTGWIHLLLAPHHLQESTILGAGFAIAGVVQITLAALALVRGRDWVWYAIIGVNAALIAIYAYAVLVGLPFGDGGHEMGLMIGAGEPIDAAGAVSKVAELASLVVAFALIGRTGEPSNTATTR